MNAFLDQSQMIHLDFMETVIQIGTIVIFPVALGMIVRNFWPIIKVSTNPNILFSTLFATVARSLSFDFPFKTPMSHGT